MQVARRFRRSQRGFTLVELAVVGATISVLMAIALPRVTATFKRVRFAEARATVSAIENAMREHWGRMDRYPVSGPRNPVTADNDFSLHEMDMTLPGWNALSYKPDGAFRYRYSWSTDATGRRVTITAEADTDNDTQFGRIIREIEDGYRVGKDVEESEAED